MRRGLLLLALCALAVQATGFYFAQGNPIPAGKATPSQTPRPAPSSERALQPAPERYKLSAERRQKAIAYSQARYVLYFAGVALSFGIYFLLWRGKIAVLFRQWVRQVSPRHFVQCLIFVPLFMAAVSLLEFALVYYSGFVLEHRFDLSTESFASWLGDWGKSFALTTALRVFLIWILYLVIRHSPRRWWLYFWLVTLPITLALILIQPVIADPLFYKFTPLEKTQPELTTRIAEMLGRAGLEIPRSRIFEMDASSKTKTVNAYVTGIGASKRVVVWDNTLKKLTPDETLLVVGHETGHYVLDHIPKEFVLIELVTLGFIFFGFIGAGRLIHHWGGRTGLEGVGDLASLPVLFLVLTALSFFASPLIGAISRHYEHQADQYGLEVAYGVVPDPNASEARALQVLGEEDLADPDPNPFIKFWLYTHPPLDERIRFAKSYKPWVEGKPLEFVHTQK